MKVKTLCPYPFNRVRVTCEGDLAMCCFQRTYPLDENTPHIGNVLKQNFDDIWFGELAEQIRDHVVKGTLHKNCQVTGCPYLYKTGELLELEYNEYPSFLEIDLPNTQCNIGLDNPGEKLDACIMCERSHPDFKPQKDLLKEVLPKISHLMSNLQYIHIQGIAEPFWRNQIFNVLDSLDFDKYQHLITVSTFTNGLLLKPKNVDKFLRRVPHSVVTFSLDAGTQETYKKIRILDGFDNVIENLMYYSKKRCKNRQYLRIHNNVNLLNIDEVIKMCHFAAKAEVDVIEFNPTDGFRTDIIVNEKNCGLFKKAQLDIIKECDKLGVNYNFLRPLDLCITDQLVQITL